MARFSMNLIALRPVQTNGIIFAADRSSAILVRNINKSYSPNFPHRFLSSPFFYGRIDRVWSSSGDG